MKKMVLSFLSTVVFCFLFSAIVFAQEPQEPPFNIDGLSGELGFLNTWKSHEDGTEDFLMQVDGALMYPVLYRFLYLRGFMNYMSPLQGEDEFFEVQVGPMFAFLEDPSELHAVWGGATFGFSNRDTWRADLYTDAIMDIFGTDIHLLYFFDFGPHIAFWRMRTQVGILLGNFEVAGLIVIDRQAGGFGPVVSLKVKDITFEAAVLYDLQMPNAISDPPDVIVDYEDIYQSWFFRFGVKGAF